MIFFLVLIGVLIAVLSFAAGYVFGMADQRRTHAEERGGYLYERDWHWPDR